MTTPASVVRVALYARVSTTDQNCGMQLRELREYADSERVDCGDGIRRYRMVRRQG